MDKKALNLLLNDKTDASRLICGLQTVLKNEYEITSFNLSEYSVDEVVYKDGIPIMVIDMKYDEDVDIAGDVISMYKLLYNPIFLLVNFEYLEDLDDECIAYARTHPDESIDLYMPHAANTVGNILLDCDVVRDISKARYESVFFSPENGGRAFRKAVDSLVDNADVLVDILKWWDSDDK